MGDALHPSPGFVPEDFKLVEIDVYETVGQQRRVREPALDYSLPLPRDWDVCKAPRPYLDLLTVPRPIGWYENGAPRPGRVGLVVTMTRVPFEVRLEDWVRQERAASGWSFARHTWRDVPDAPRLECWSTKGPLACATIAFSDGGRIFATHAVGRALARSEIAAAASYAVQLRLRRPATPGRLEARTTVCVGAYTFEIPRSWSWLPDQTAARLVHPSGPTRARLELGVHDEVASVQARRGAYRKRLRAHGWSPSRSFGPGPSGLRADGWSFCTLVATNPAGDDVDILMAHGPSGRIEIHARSSKQTMQCWRRTVRALEIAAQTCSVVPDFSPS